MTCHPSGDLASPLPQPDRCRCGATIRPVPRADDWAWEDEHGQTAVWHHAEILAEYQRLCDAVNTGTADETDWAHYSTWTAALNLGHVNWGHQHSPTGTAGATLTPPPWCCGQPMQAIPRGWRCRVGRTVEPYTDLLGGLWAA